MDLNDLRGLALLLSPSEKIAAGEVADVASALVAVASHGEAVLEAADNGAQGVADFFHNLQVEKAKALGAEEPRRGAPVENVPLRGGLPGANSGVTASDLSKLKAEIVGEFKDLLAELLGTRPAPAATAEPAEAADPHAAASPAPGIFPAPAAPAAEPADDATGV